MGEMQQIVLTQYCVGEPKPSDFKLETLPLPEPKDGQFRVRHVWCSVDPGTRSRLSPGASYAPPLKPGAMVDGFAVGEVIESRHPRFAAGELGLDMYALREPLAKAGLKYID